jgi:integrase
VRSIRLKQAPTKPVLVVSHEQWRRLEEALTYPPVMLYARLNVTTWARRCEMIGFRPSDFDFGQQMLNVTRSTVYVNAAYHPSGRAGWFTKDHRRTVTGGGSRSPSRCAWRCRSTSKSTGSGRRIFISAVDVRLRAAGAGACG